MAPAPAEQLSDLLPGVLDELQSAHDAREAALSACRQAIRSSSRAIRAVHRLQMDAAAELADAAEAALREAQGVVLPHPAMAHAGFVHDAAKEYVEARCTIALASGTALPTAAELEVGLPAWLNGLAEAASEMRRHLLDRLRAGDLAGADDLLAAMDGIYDLLVSVDFPDGITGGLRRTTDALRAVLERSRSDLTTTAMQTQLQRAVERAAAATAPPGNGTSESPGR